MDSLHTGVSGDQDMLRHVMDMGGMGLTTPISVSISSMTSPDIKPNLSSLSAISSQTGSYFGYGMHLGMESSQTGSVHSQPLCSSSLLASPSMMSPVSATSLNNQHMPHTTLSNKHMCTICGDRASGKHYGVYSCEGCKGFFKRTVRKDLTYACRDDRNCMIDKRQRNRCQFCRYMKCLSMGMKREAVQEERQRNKEKGDEAESTINANSDMPVEQVLAAEISVEPKTDTYIDVQKDAVTNIVQGAEKQLITLVYWAKRIPHFSELNLNDQICLLKAGWHELLIASFSHRSMCVKDGFLLSTGLYVHRSSAHDANVGTIFDRVLTELVAKMREMKMDKTELGCLRAIVLFNPDAKDLKSIQEVEQLREKVYASLEEYCKKRYPDEPGRFAKLLLRLPALRSIGLKCLEHLLFFKQFDKVPMQSFLLEFLEMPNLVS